MNHTDHVGLLKRAELPRGGTWADLGAGTGAFTLALRELVGPDATIYAVDRDRGSLTELQRAYLRRFGEAGSLQVLRADFSDALELPALDGILMANSLHFVKDRLPVLRGVREYVRSGGLVLLVEYNVDKGNPWVPFPLSFATFQELAPSAGFTAPRLLATHPSSFLGEFYSAATSRKEAPAM